MDTPKNAPVPRELAWQIKQMYEEKLPNGKRKYSQARLAKLLQVSEGTVWRAVNDLGRFGIDPLPEVKAEDQLAREARESLEKALKMKGPLGEAMRAAKAEQEKMQVKTVAERMTAEAAQQRKKLTAGDDLLKELTDGKQ